MCTITWELFHFYSESKIDWDLKAVTLKHDVQFIYNTLHHYREHITANTNTNTNIGPKTTQTLSTVTLNYKSLKSLWVKQQKDLLDVWNIDFSKLKEKVDYIVAPLYKTANFYIIGIILLTLDTNIIKKLMKNSKQPIIYNFLSHINSELQFNIIRGVLENSINQVKDKYIVIKQYDTKKNKYLDDEIKIYLEEVFCNIRNYFPKIQIEYTKQQQNIFYKVFSKSSKSIMLPTSLPATLSATS